jgi:uncharacterized protein
MRLPLTDVERLILANQYEILSVLHEDEGYGNLAKQLRDGHEWLYGDFQNLAEVMPRSDAEHVLAVLDLYEALADSFESVTDKSGIEVHDVTFPGFDGNNESDYLSFSGALAASGRYVHILGKDGFKNSHMPTTDIYRRMLEKHAQLGKPRLMTKEQIAEVVAARTHPSRK